MSKSEQIDHKAEALRLARYYAEAADREASRGNLEPATTFAFTSQAHSNLAIADELHATRSILANTLSNIEDRLADGQERVAEAIADAAGDDSKLDLILHALRALEPSS